MALCIAQVAATDVPIDAPEGLDAIAQGFLDWLRDGTTDVSTQTRYVLGALRDDDGSPGLAERMTAVAAELHARTGRTAGNGALMRAAPAALAFPGDAERTAGAVRRIAERTHGQRAAGMEAHRHGGVPGGALDLGPEGRPAPTTARPGRRRAADTATASSPNGAGPAASTDAGAAGGGGHSVTVPGSMAAPLGALEEDEPGGMRCNAGFRVMAAT